VDWPGLVRKYVWDEQRTPYLVRADRLTPGQARSELFVYAFLLAVLAAVVALVAAAGRAGAPGSPLATLYALTLLAGAVALGVTGHPAAAAYCATAPVAMGLGALAGVLRPDMAGGERVILMALSGCWLGYAARVVRIALRLSGRG
jgi:FtsH-binding integral membrane protein